MADRCDSAIAFASEEKELFAVGGATFDVEPLPTIPPLRCELDAGHRGTHRSGIHTWTRVDQLELAR